MAILGSEKGAALVTALMLTVLALVISMTLLYSVTTGIRISASQKRYRTALAAAHGGVEVLAEELIPALFQVANPDQLVQLQNQFSRIDLQAGGYDCLHQKIDSPTNEWNLCSAAQGGGDPELSPDFTFRLRGPTAGEKGFMVSSKIVDTIPGNSDKSGIDYLDTGSSVAGKDEVIHPRHVPGIYSISVQGVKEGAEAREKARLSVLYAY